MLVGPLLAAALVPARGGLRRELAMPRAPGRRPRSERVEWTGRLAAGLSIVSAALRYHTAESSPHGAAALALALAFASALYARRTGVSEGVRSGRPGARPPRRDRAARRARRGASRSSRSPRRADRARCSGRLGAALPGAALLLAANRAAVGHAFASPFAFYAARVAPAAAAGGAKAVALAALKRLRANLADVANFEPIALLPVLLFRRSARARLGAPVAWAAALVLAQALVLGLAARGEVSPGAGAGALANVLPVEHALVAVTLVFALPAAWLAPAASATLALALAGFAVHMSPDHERLAAEGLGRPRYEPDVAREAGATQGLLFFDDDEGYELAHDPGAVPSRAVQAVRARGDDHDRLLYDLLGRPQAHRYVSAGHATRPSASWTPSGSGDAWRFEAEADFPGALGPDPPSGGSSVVERGACASDAPCPRGPPGGRGAGQRDHRAAGPASVAGARSASWRITPRVFQQGTEGTGDLVLVTSTRRAPRSPSGRGRTQVRGIPCARAARQGRSSSAATIRAPGSWRRPRGAPWPWTRRPSAGAEGPRRPDPSQPAPPARSGRDGFARWVDVPENSVIPIVSAVHCSVSRGAQTR